MKLVVLFVLLTSACVRDRSVRPNDQLDPKSAYIYGRFFVTSRPPASASGVELWFDLECADRQKYLIKVRRTLDVQVMAVRPSRCTVSKIYAIRNAAPLGSDPVTAVPGVELVAGRAYYVGAQVARFEDGVAMTEAEAAEWERRVGQDEYASATAELKQAYPNLGALPTENRMIPLPAR